MLHDFRYAFRIMLRNPAFAAIAILTLALGIGASTAVFSLVNALLIRPLPYEKPEQLVLMLQHFRAQHLDAIPVSPPEFLDYKAQLRSFDKLAAFDTATFNLAENSRPERVFGAVVSADLFPLLGVKPILGRIFRPEECAAGRNDVVVISERLWKRRFNRDPQILGRTISANGAPLTIVGIMPERFEFPLSLFNLPGGKLPETADIWRPLAFTDAEMKARYSRSYLIIGRLANGVSARQAQAETDAVAAAMRKRFPKSYPQNDSFGASLYPLKEQVVGNMRPLLFILLGAVALVLLIACANLSTMLLARASAREREMAIRVAVGANRWRLLRQTLAESLVLSLCGASGGVLLAIWAVDLVKRWGTTAVPRLGEVNVDGAVLLGTLVVAAGTGLIFGLIPGLTSGRPNLNEVLKDGGRGAAPGSQSNRLRNILVVAEVALALVLLTCAGLFIKSFVRLQNVSAGFNTDNVVTMEISLPTLKYADAHAQANFFAEVDQRVAALPGVTFCGLANILPMSGINSDSSFAIEGRMSDDAHPFPDEELRVVTPNYFRVLKTPLLKGRFFAMADKIGAPPVTIINDALAQRYWPNQQALGKRINLGSDTKPVWTTIVGIVGDIRHRGFAFDVAPEFYLPLAQSPTENMILTVRSAQDPRGLITAIRAEVQRIDHDQPIAHVRTLEQVVADSVAPRRLSILLLGVFAGIALLMAAVGIYGVMSFLVVQRTHELGVRMALGAQRSDLLRLIILHALKLIGLGTAAGLVATLGSVSILRSSLFNVSAFDLPTFCLTTLALAVIAAFASYLPALRATRADPMIALGHG